MRTFRQRERSVIAFCYPHVTQKLHLEDRIVPIPGNLAQPLLGLPPDTFKVLATEIDAIVHNGVDVNLVNLYAALKSVNVLGTQEVLCLAVTNGLAKTRVKPFHYISKLERVYNL
ncbi:hypothetical protein PsorP6_006822 [Peronosclerospora sorghi]|uniref:Uncharacterized protein n=1 Tax=Peronosclerospora sorghi TaxID=230839 RepID=A0ACC0W784_9STRA|nr:hypothetical protein PsorP6_006822 [Peronosclerospora sorghi]